MTNAVRAVFWLPVWMGLLDAADFTPPPTKAVPVTETLHGIQITDLARLLRKGTIPNVGRPNAPRIRARDLPRKVHPVADQGAGGYNVGANARSLLARRATPGGTHGET